MKKNDFILAIDQGTTGTTAMLVDEQLQVHSKANVEFAQHFPKPSWVEHIDTEIWGSLEQAVKCCLDTARIRPEQIAAIGITNQRETTCLFDKSGRALHPFIVWQCRRTADRCQSLKEQGHANLFRNKTGLVLDPYFSGTKLAWLREKVGDGLFGTIDTWLLYRLTAGAVHATDATNASRTLMMNLETGVWDNELLSILEIPKTCLPQIVSSSEVIGHTKNLSFLPDGIPIASLIGDQQAALFGQGCFQAGEAKATFGTGCFILMNTGHRSVRSTHGLLSSVAVKIGSQTQYCLEGSAFIAGAAVQWLRDGLGLIQKSDEMEALAKQVESSGDVVFVPALAGLGAPHWRPEARGLFAGITRDTSKAHLARAVLEGIALQNHDILDAMQKDVGAMTLLKVDGGASANDLLMQFQADILNVPCERPKQLDSTALGAAMLAGMAIGMFKFPFQRTLDAQVFKPSMAIADRETHLRKWQCAIEKA